MQGFFKRMDLQSEILQSQNIIEQNIINEKKSQNITSISKSRVKL
jgi:hypothetical protein